MKPTLVMVLKEDTTEEQFKAVANVLKQRIEAAPIIVKKGLIDSVFLGTGNEDYRLERIVENDDLIIRLVHKT